MTNVAITGASGTVGREVVEAFSGREKDLTLFSHSETDDLETTTLEIEDREALVDALEGQDVLIHLAANPSPEECRRLVVAAATTTIESNPTVAHGISANADRFLSLTRTMLDLGCRPRDDTHAALEDEVDSRNGIQSG